MKRLLLLFLTTWLAVDMWAQDTYVPDFTIDGINYTIVNEDDKYVEVGPTDTTTKNITIPEYITTDAGDYRVIGLGREAFSSTANNTWKTLLSISLPESIEYIDDYSFYCCNSLYNINFPEGLTRIGDYVFYMTSLSEVVLPSTLTYLGGAAFWNNGTTVNMRSITSLATTPPTCSEPMNDYIIGSTSLHEVFDDDTYDYATLYVPAEALDEYAEAYVWKNFRYTREYGLPTFTDDDGLVYNVLSLSEKTCELGVQTTSASSYDIPETVEYEGNTYTVVGLGTEAFQRIGTKLETISLPSTTQYIGDYAFSGCSNLTDVSFPEGTTSLQSVGDYAFNNCTGLTSLYLPGEKVSIGEWAFNNCTNLETLTYIYALGDIGYRAFHGDQKAKCPKVSSPLTFGGNIGERAFYNCVGLTEIYFVDGVTTIEDNAFYGCTGITSDIVLSSTVKEFGGYALCGCSGIKNVTLNEGLETLGNGTLSKISISEITIPSTIRTMGNQVFEEDALLVAVTFPEDATITSFGTNVFRNCTSLKEVNILSDISSLSQGTFYGCNALETVVLPETLTSLSASNIFYDCSKIKSITSLNPTPPTCTTSTFNYVDTTNGMLYVPVGSKEAYAEATGWEDFLNIVEMTNTDEPEGISSIYVDNENNENIESIYSTSGQKFNSPQRGVNIIRYTDGSVKKISVK